MLPRARHALATLFVLAVASCALSRVGTPDPNPKVTCDANAPCDDGNPCTVDACGPDGLCTTTNAPDGESPTAIAGNCHHETCASGKLIQTVDDTDVPNDGEPCTTDLCVKGKPTEKPLANASACDKEGNAGSCKSGVCVVACGAGKPACTSANPCLAAACDLAAGACVFTSLHGVPVPGKLDNKGDCKTALCVKGQAEDVNDDGDLPKTQNPCDLEICTSGVPSNPPAPLGSLCSTPAGGNVCDANGNCVGCNTPADCPDKDGPCKKITCKASVCGADLEPAGFVPPSVAQVPDDCQRKQCDGKGSVVIAPDPTDDDDGRECTVDACKNGIATHTPKPLGSACGPQNALKCDANGDCKDCLGDGDCGGTTDCKLAACKQGKCGFNNVAAGTVLAPGKQTPNDCRVNECDGAGAVTNVGDDADLPTNVCQTCTSGQITVRFDQSCPLGMGMGVCSAGATCVACNSDPECPAAPGPCVLSTCSMNACVMNNAPMGTVLPAGFQTSGDCKIVICDGAGASVVVPQVSDLPNDNNVCTTDSCTAAGAPSFTDVGAGMPPPSGMCTPPAKVCDGMGACVGCVSNANCTSPAVCFGTSCCTPATCGSLGVTCGTPSDTCGGALSCSGGKNGGETDVDCGGPAAACSARCAQGQKCVATSDCGAGLTCADGFCCNAVCGATCMACSNVLTGKPNGTCAPILPDTDPKMQCPGGSCAANVFTGSKLCDGVGACTHGGGMMICAPYVCAASGCKTSCMAHADCVALDYCNGTNSCVPKGLTGASCTANVQCVSNVCLPANTCQ